MSAYWQTTEGVSSTPSVRQFETDAPSVYTLGRGQRMVDLEVGLS